MQQKESDFSPIRRKGAIEMGVSYFVGTLGGGTLDQLVSVPGFMHPLQGHILDFFAPVCFAGLARFMGGEELFGEKPSLPAWMITGFGMATLTELIEGIPIWGPNQKFDPLDILSFGLGTSLIIGAHVVEKQFDRRHKRKKM